MHDTDIDKELHELIQKAMKRGNHVQQGLLSKAADRLKHGESLPSELDTEILELILDGDAYVEPDSAPGSEVVLYEPAGEVELRNQPRVPDTISPSSDALRFEAEVHEGLATFVEMLKTYPMTAKTPEFRVEVRNKLEEAVEQMDRAS